MATAVDTLVCWQDWEILTSPNWKYLHLGAVALINDQISRLLEVLLTLLIWSLFFATVVTFGMYVYYISKVSVRDTGIETGQAILRFGKVFPMEAIREVIMTENGDSFFLRLHGNRTGCILAYQKYAVCKILEAGSVKVRSGPTDASLSIEFDQDSIMDSVFTFRSPKDAAEVSLWLLGGFVSVSQLPEMTEEDPTLLPPGTGR
jgi:hypothetical protein